MLVGIGGTVDGQELRKDGEYDVHPGVGAHLVRNGYAEAVRERPVETTAVAPSETTAKRVRKPRARKS
jgi:hypothetical protein